MGTVIWSSILQILLSTLRTHSKTDTILDLKEIIKELSVYGWEKILTRPD